MELSDITWPMADEALRKREDIKAVTVLGSAEQHGPHLPLGTDTLIGEAIWRRIAAERDDVLLLPAIPVGCSEVWRSFPGTISLRSSTLMMLIEDMADSLIRHGVGTLVLQCSHGGNFYAAASAARQYSLRDTPLRIFIRMPFSGLPKDAAGGRDYGHACEVETSMALAAFPHLVHMEKAAEGRVKAWEEPRSHSDDAFMPGESGVKGSPGHANAEKGESILEAMRRDACLWLDSL